MLANTTFTSGAIENVVDQGMLVVSSARVPLLLRWDCVPLQGSREVGAGRGDCAGGESKSTECSTSEQRREGVGSLLHVERRGRSGAGRRMRWVVEAASVLCHEWLNECNAG